MADEPTGEDEVLELNEAMEVPPEGQTETQPDGDEELIVSIGDEAAPASEEAPEWVRDLRKRNRELERENAEYRKAQQSKVPQAGPEPTLESCGWDEDEFKSKWREWNAAKVAEERAVAEAQKAQQQEAEKFANRVRAYGAQKDSLGVKDFDQAEAEVLSALSDVQKRVLIHGAKNKAALVLALGRSPEKLRELASNTDLIDFAFEAGRLEKEIKMERRKVTTQPDSEVRGSASVGGNTDKELERLEAEAVRTGNRSKVIAYKRKLKEKSR
jgi:hypothetical protein